MASVSQPGVYGLMLFPVDSCRCMPTVDSDLGSTRRSSSHYRRFVRINVVSTEVMGLQHVGTW